MELKIVCQICGKHHTLDTHKAPNHWVSFRLAEDIIDDLPAWSNYEIWICDKCIPGRYELDYDESGEFTVFNIDHDTLYEQLKKGLRISKKDYSEPKKVS